MDKGYMVWFTVSRYHLYTQITLLLFCFLFFINLSFVFVFWVFFLLNSILL